MSSEDAHPLIQTQDDDDLLREMERVLGGRGRASTSSNIATPMSSISLSAFATPTDPLSSPPSAPAVTAASSVAAALSAAATTSSATVTAAAAEKKAAAAEAATPKKKPPPKADKRFGVDSEDSSSSSDEEGGTGKQLAKDGAGASQGEQKQEKKRSQPHQKKSLMLLYISHCLSAWGDRSWEFAISLFLIEIWPESITLVSTYGLLAALTVVLFGALIGDYVDNKPRMEVVRKTLFLQNLCVALCAASLLTLLVHGSDLHDGVFWILVVLIMGLGTVSELASLATTLAVEKDWVVVVCEGNTELLAHTNAVLRRIDLSCLILAPLVVGFIMTYLGTMAGAILIGVWNLVSLAPEYMMLTRVFKEFSALSVKEYAARSEGPRETTLQKVFKQFVNLARGWSTYSQQPTLWPGLALAFLYCTVLSFGSIMTAYLYHRGVAEATLAAVRGVGALCGIVATFVYPLLQKRLGLVKTATFSVWAQLACLGLAVTSLLVGRPEDGSCSSITDLTSLASCIKSRNLEVGLLMGGVAISRIGLWSFDLAVNQQLQQWPSQQQLGLINGVQSALQNVLWMLSYVFGVIFSKPEQFPILVGLSVAFVGLAALINQAFALGWIGHFPGQASRAATAPLSVQCTNDDKDLFGSSSDEEEDVVVKK